jgi:anti-anti-sigma regulatory factor
MGDNSSVRQGPQRCCRNVNIRVSESGTFLPLGPLGGGTYPVDGKIIMQDSKYFDVSEFEGAVEIQLGSCDFVSRPIIVLAFEEMSAYVDKYKPKLVVLNFKNVHHVSSEFITEMIRLNDHVGGNDGTIRLSHMSDEVELPFKITNLSGTLFKVYETTPQAIDAS